MVDLQSKITLYCPNVSTISRFHRVLVHLRPPVIGTGLFNSALSVAGSTTIAAGAGVAAGPGGGGGGGGGEPPPLPLLSAMLSVEIKLRVSAPTQTGV